MSATVIFAQELTETYTFNTGAEFSYPSDYEPTEFRSGVTLRKDNVVIELVNFLFFQDRGFDLNSDYEDLIKWNFDYLGYSDDGGTIDESKFNALTIDGRDALEYGFSDNIGDVYWLPIEFSNGSYGMVYAYTEKQEKLDFDLIAAIAESYDNTEEVLIYSNVLDETVQFADGATFSYPSTSFFEMFTNEDGFGIKRGATSIEVLDFPFLVRNNEAEPGTTPAEIIERNLNWIFAEEESIEFDPSYLQDILVNGKRMTSYLYTDDVGDIMWIVVPYEDGTYGIVYGYTVQRVPLDINLMKSMAGSYVNNGSGTSNTGSNIVKGTPHEFKTGVSIIIPDSYEEVSSADNFISVEDTIAGITLSVFDLTEFHDPNISLNKIAFNVMPILEESYGFEYDSNQAQLVTVGGVEMLEYMFSYEEKGTVFPSGLLIVPLDNGYSAIVMVNVLSDKTDEDVRDTLYSSAATVTTK
ncbi:hypothetical protein MASR2M15_25900 [Anaerolineales bacterium]